MLSSAAYCNAIANGHYAERYAVVLQQPLVEIPDRYNLSVIVLVFKANMALEHGPTCATAL